MTNDKWDLRFLALASHIAQWSKDPSTQCGAVLVRPDRTIASTGFNGFPQQIVDQTAMLESRPEKYKRIIHAEMNALLFLAERGDGLTLYTWPFMTCERCAVCVIQAGIVRVVSLEATDQAAERWRNSFQTAEALYQEAHVAIDLFQLDILNALD